MLLIVGLGNPGNKYAENRHNIGFMAVDEIVRRHNFLPEKKKFQSLAHEGNLGGEKCLILKPQTYMNKSGQAVAEAARFYKVDVSNIIVFHDELDLPAGKIRVKTGGGHAGHNGLRDITNHMGADFHRVRLGIGHPGDKNLVHNYVLGDFAKSDQSWLDTLLYDMADAADWIGKGDLKRFQSDVAAKAQPKKEKMVKTEKVSPKHETKTKEGPMAAALRALKKLGGDK